MEKLNSYIIQYDLLNKIDIDFLQQNITIPIYSNELYLLVAIDDENKETSRLSIELNKPLKTITFSKIEILQALQYSKEKIELYNISKNLSSDSNIDKFLNLLIIIALELNSSDIHIESSIDNMVIRFRIDGILKHFITLSKEFLAVLSSYIKLKSNLDISLKRTPQDSRFSEYIHDTKYDFRVSTMPTIEGESIVLRILKNDSVNKNLSTLGFSEDIYERIKKNIYQNSGLILITGPTGSGKTTSLYSIIKELNNDNKKIITIEDPVEYKIKNIQQVSINNKIGLTFEKVLTNILRQDPDIILIGEIRDKESLKIAIQASLTGHLVLATLHTNSAINTIDRMLDLECEPFLLASTLKTIISQRLIRKLCDTCKEYDEKTKSYKATGCNHCNYDGYKDRVILYEMLEVDDKVSNMIAKETSSEDILQYLQENSYKDIKSYSNELLKNGVSSLDEVYKVVKL